VMNASGGTSYRYPKLVSYKPSVPGKQKLYFIGIGSSKFATAGNDLNWCVSDINSLAGFFKRKYGNSIVIDTIFDKHVTIDSVKHLKERLLKSNVNDKVIVAFSGHGLLDNYRYFLSTYNINFDKPSEGGLPYEQLYDLLDGIPARKKLMLIDACNSGELDTVIVKTYDTLKNILKTEGVKGTIVSNIDTGKLGIYKIYSLTQELFVDVRKSVGATVIAASSALELAKEDNNLRNGVFTYVILEALKKNKTLTVNDLKQIVETKVPEITKGLQKPTARNQTINNNWLLW
jgi:caspase domain-containing protein